MFDRFKYSPPELHVAHCVVSPTLRQLSRRSQASFFEKRAGFAPNPHQARGFLVTTVAGGLAATLG